jgi:diguanylate cyclase (GGDEF)-like protein
MLKRRLQDQTMGPVVSPQELPGLRHRPPLTDRAQSILRVLREPVLVVDADDTIHPMNPAGEHIADLLDGNAAEARAHICRAARQVLQGTPVEPLPIGLRVGGAHQYFEATVTADDDEAVVVLRDVTAEASVREVLLESRQRYKQLVEVAADFVWECDETGAFSYITEPGAFGFPPDQLIGRRPARFLATRSAVWPDRAAGPVRGHAVAVVGAEGRPLRLALDAAPILDRSGMQRGVRGIGRIADHATESERDAADADRSAIDEIVAALQSEWNAETALHNGAEAACRAFSARTCVVHGLAQGDGWLKLAEAGAARPNDQAAAALDAFCERRARTILAGGDGDAITAAVHNEGQLVGAVTLWRAADTAPWTDADAARLADQGPAWGVAIRQTLEMRRLVRLSRTDPLTGLLNRRAFLLELTAALARASRKRSAGALLYIDLDNFKRLNDVCGHEAGNLALTEVGAILTHAIRPYDLAVRLGGDEFALWLEEIGTGDAGRSARRIAAAIADWSSGHSPAGSGVAASIGVAMFDPERPESPDDLIERADRAMYRAKRTPDKAVAIARRRRTPGRTGAQRRDA